MNELEIIQYLKDHLEIRLSDEWANWQNDTHIFRVKLYIDDDEIASDYIDVEDIK